MQRDQIHLGFPVVSMPDVAKRGGVSRRLGRKCLGRKSGPEAAEYHLCRKLGLYVYGGSPIACFFY